MLSDKAMNGRALPTHILLIMFHSALLEQLIRHLRPPEDGNHLPKHVGIESGTR
jgi:hypothetical protein